MGTSSVRRLRVVAPTPNQHEPAPHEPQEPSPSPPATDSGDEQAGLDAASTGMALLLRLTLRFMRSYSDKR